MSFSSMIVYWWEEICVKLKCISASSNIANEIDSERKTKNPGL